MQIQPYLFFEGRCEEALAFYARALGAETIALMRYRDAPPAGDKAHATPPGAEDKVMHASFRIGESTLMASDGFASGQSAFKGFSLTLNVADVAEAQQVFARLAEGGQITLPLGATFYSPAFGMLTDRFGIGWMVMAP